jgi:SAM-dependent methyltransferase
MPGFKDHFSDRALTYASARPMHPPELLGFVASLAPSRERVWDCATGNGQAAVGLAAHFDHVIASDASAAQIAHAHGHPRVSYAVALAERCALRDASVAAVTVAQALHWLEVDAFYREARRVLRPGGAVAVWAYGDVRALDDHVQATLHWFTRGLLGPFWPPERRIVDEEYHGIAFPFDEIVAPSFALELAWNLGELLAYAGTWSATAAFARAMRCDPVPLLEAPLRERWGDPARRRRLRWEFSLRAGHAA